MEETALRINLSPDKELNTSIKEDCNACVYNGRIKFDILQVAAVDFEDKSELHLLFEPDEKLKGKITTFMEHFNESKGLEAVVYPISENGMVLAQYIGSEISVFDDDGSYAVVLKYTDKDEITQEISEVNGTPVSDGTEVTEQRKDIRKRKPKSGQPPTA